jgi:hypothetical protein
MHPGEFDGSRALEGQSAGEQPVDNDTERIDVGRGRGRFATHLFGRDVCGRAENRSGVGQRVCPLNPRDAEVRDLRTSLRIEQDVARLQISVDHAMFVCMGEPGGDIARDLSNLIVGDVDTVRESLVERTSGEVLEDHVPPLLVPEVEELDDVRMRERRDGARLSLETGSIGVWRQQLDDNTPAQGLIERQPDLGHRGRTEHFLQAVSTGQQR